MWGFFPGLLGLAGLVGYFIRVVSFGWLRVIEPWRVGGIRIYQFLSPPAEVVDFLLDAVEVFLHVGVEGNHASRSFDVLMDGFGDLWIIDVLGEEKDGGPCVLDPHGTVVGVVVAEVDDEAIPQVVGEVAEEFWREWGGEDAVLEHAIDGLGGV